MYGCNYNGIRSISIARTFNAANDKSGDVSGLHTHDILTNAIGIPDQCYMLHKELYTEQKSIDTIAKQARTHTT
jgi:hypothetical protein